MKNLFIVPIEPIETRYTKHWYQYFPSQFAKNTKFNVVQLELPEDKTIAPKNDAGGFFNFTFTSSFKANQVQLIADLFSTNQVNDGDVFLFTDYWNPAVGFLKYIAAMAKKTISVVGIAHAGLWDPADMLTKTFGEEEWGRKTELYLNSCFDYILFATEFSRSLFEKTYQSSNRHIVTGFPMEYYSEILPNYWDLTNRLTKQDIVVFPHRKATEKGFDLFLELKRQLPEFDFRVALDECSTKEEYHNLLYSSKVAFSSATQETLGISMGIETLCAGVVPLVPNRLSYSELFSGSKFFFDDSTIESSKLAIRNAFDTFDYLSEDVKIQRQISDKWFTGNRMYEFLNSIHDSNKLRS